MPSSANGAPLHFQNINFSNRNGKAQSVSAGVHIALLALLLFAAFSVSNPGAPRDATLLGPSRTILPYILARPDITGKPSLGKEGGGGEREDKPTRAANLAPFSPMPLAPPRLNRNENPELPAPPAVLDPNAPASVSSVTNLGLPWMKSDTDSAGPGNSHGFGNGDGNSMGDGSRNGAGEGEDEGAYANVATQVTCVYCPQPSYTDEARKMKLQGKLLLRVLVGTDGRAQRIQIIQGLGMGLDERAVEALRGWRFSPARDANKRAVPTWVTVETRFQLL
jgi:periplasmic protein TonB